MIDPPRWYIVRYKEKGKVTLGMTTHPHPDAAHGGIPMTMRKASSILEYALMIRSKLKPEPETTRHPAQHRTESR